jgi:dTDP-glucose 4,6-dehydratase
MKVLIYGANGWIGSQFCNFLNEKNIKYSKGISRVDNISELTKETNNINPTHIISFIGRTHGKIGDKIYSTIDYLEEPGKLKENINDNLFGPILLSDICKKKNIHFTYLGTGCIFKYDEDHLFETSDNGFTEESLPNFFGSSYSIVKGFTDRLMNDVYNDTLNLRIRMPITGEENSRNFISKIIKYEKICSIKNSMTVLPDMYPIILDMMKNCKKGTFNLTNPGFISHNEILELYKEIVDNNFVWNNFSQEEQLKILKADRSNNYLETEKLTTLYPSLPTIRESIINCLHQYKDSKSYKVLITGGCGFIGSNFLNYFFKNNSCKIIVNIDAMYYCADEKNISLEIRESNKYKFIKNNLSDTKILESILNEYQIDYIFHFAAQSHVQNSFEDPMMFTKDNIIGTHNLLEACRSYNKCKKIIIVSTDEVYGESKICKDESKKTENSILKPTNPYACSKAGADLYAQSYIHSFNLPIIITRGNNVYGINQYPEKLIPKFIKLLTENKKLTIQGCGKTTRSFLNILDTVKAFDIIFKKGKIGEIYNIGCDEGMEYSVMEIAHKLISLLKPNEKIEDWIEFIQDRPFNDARYYISNEKLKKLGWSIDIFLDEGLKQLL